MPKVAGKKYPYTKSGMAAAKVAAKKVSPATIKVDKKRNKIPRRS